MSIELGTKVLCEGYIKRNNNYIDDSLEHQKELCRQNNKEFKLVSAYNKADAATVTLMPPSDLGDGFFVSVMERV